MVTSTPAWEGGMAASNAQPAAAQPTAFDGQADISARLERLPITKKVFWARNIIGAAIFLDGYTVVAIAPPPNPSCLREE
jgi:MFS transporter, putative metabolite:H+ symporter